MQQEGPLSLIRASLMGHISGSRSSITSLSLAADWSPAATMSASPRTAEWGLGIVTSGEA